MIREAAEKHLKSISKLRSFLSSQRERLDRALTERPAAPSVDGFSYLPYLDHLDAELAGVERVLIDAEGTYHCDRTQVAAYRRLSGKNRERLFRLQSDVKRLLAGLLPAGLEGTAIAGATPQGTEALEDQAKETLFILREIDRMQPPLIVGVTVNAAAFAEKLEAALAKLKASNGKLIEAEAGAAGSRAIADHAVAEVGRVVPWVTRCVEGLCGLAGYEKWVGRIRGRVARRG